MDRTEALEHVKAATDSLTHCGHPKYLENPVTDEEKSFLRDLFAAGVIVLKQLAQKPEPIDGGNGYWGQFACPRCGDTVLMHQNAKCCDSCFAQQPAQGTEMHRLIQLLSENRDTLQAAKQYLEYDSSTGRYAYDQVTRQIEACQAAIDDLSGTASTAWQPIKTAPKDGSHLLLFRPDICFTGYHAKAGWVVNAPGLPLMEPEPTHWMPPPLFPKQGAKA